MKIYNDRRYSVEKYAISESNDANYGILSGADVKRLLKGYTYEEEMEMWFSPKAQIGYSIIEA